MQKLLPIFLCTFLSLTLFGQFQDPKQIIPHDTYVESIKLADLNGDGHQDIIASSPFAWYPTEGDDTFIHQRKIGNQSASILSKIEAADFDKDGDLDLLVAEKSNKTLLWYENDGQGNFETKHIVSNTLEYIQDFVVDDWNKDEDMDIIVTLASGWNADENGKISKFENDGTGNFSFDGSIIASSTRGYYKIFLADLNNNGHADVVVNHSDGGVIILDGLGGGNFNTNQDTGQINELPLYEASSSFYYETFEATFADFNGDGYLDIIPRFDYYDEIVWYENNQSGRFTEFHIIESVDLFFVEEVSVGDLDKDGDIDILFGSRGISWVANQ